MALEDQEKTSFMSGRGIEVNLENIATISKLGRPNDLGSFNNSSDASQH
jgi:hypothetical protein